MLVEARVTRVRLVRQDIVQHASQTPQQRVSSRDLLSGDAIRSLERHGKNLAILGVSGRVLCVHLGMSGQLRFVPHGKPFTQTDHVHCSWWIESPAGKGRLMFRDPRRFGGLRPFRSVHDLRKAWAALGPDALEIAAPELRDRLRNRKRPIKAALLDQSLIAGVGNIYADEALFLARIHPSESSGAISLRKFQILVEAIKSVMLAAIDSGGSTIRSYIDSDGQGGSFVHQHQVYGRADEPCKRCSRSLCALTLGGRTTVFCTHCQVRSSLK